MLLEQCGLYDRRITKCIIKWRNSVPSGIEIGDKASVQTAVLSVWMHASCMQNLNPVRGLDGAEAHDFGRLR